MALKQKKPTTNELVRAWFMDHNGIACVAIAVCACAAVLALFLFVVFSGFGASADFIYNQF